MLTAWLQQSKHKQMIKFCLFCLFCLAAGALVWGAFALMHSPDAQPEGPTLQLTTGFDGKGAYRSDYWTPVHVLLTNDGTAFKGTLAIRTYSDPSFSSYSDAVSPWSFTTTVVLPKGSDKQITLNAPHFLDPYNARGYVATLSNEQGHVVATKFSMAETEIKPGDIMVGVLTNDVSGFNALKGIGELQGESNSPTVVQLDASQLPSMETLLDNFDIIVLENFPTSTLNAAQLQALQNWVNRGGILFEVGGLHWQQTLGTLPATLLPVKINGLDVLPAGANILPPRGTTPIELEETPNQTDPPLDASLIVSTATAQQNQHSFSSVETLLANGQNDLIVKAHQGAGLICYLGLDPASLPLSNWSGTANQFWPTMLLQTLGDKLLIPDTAMGYESGPGQILTRGGILSLMLPALPQGPWVISIFLLAYILVLGPISLLLVRRFKQPRFWRWRILASCILVFTALAYTLAATQRSAALTSNSVSLIQIDQGGSSAHITTYTGLFTPNEGNFQLHIPGENLTEPISTHFLQGNAAVSPSSDAPATLTNTSDGTDMTLKNQNYWSLHPLETEQDAQLPGSIVTHLKIDNNRLVGTITNTLNTSLSDLYVLFPHTFVPISHIKAGATVSIDAPLHTTPGGAGMTLADQIATYNKLGNGYFPYSHKKLPQTVTQLHMALLSALSGTGYSYDPCNGSCLTHSIISKGVIYTTGGQVPNPNLKNDYDPLLISGAPATLIGWADQSPVDVASPTVNGHVASGQQTNFVQMPLTLQLSGNLQIPQDFMPGSVIDVQSDNAQAVLPGVYTLDEGQVTFELPVPNQTQMQLQSLVVNVPDLIAHPAGPGSGASSYQSNIQVQFYNWETGAWENARPLTQESITLTDMAKYAGPTGRVLIEVEAINDSQMIYFGKPSLSLNGIGLDSQ